MSAVELKPTSLRRDGDGLAIEWNDGVKAFVSFRELRKNCPCASCNEQRQKPPDPFKLLSDSEVAAGSPTPVKMQPRGHYAYQIVWNDGHDTGIYTLELLRQLGKPATV
jgi:DUF971 family protein